MNVTFVFVSVLSFIMGWIVRGRLIRLKRILPLPQPINVIEQHVLPDPDDAGWSDYLDIGFLRLEGVEVRTLSRTVYLHNICMNGPRWSHYANAVVEAYLDRRAGMLLKAER